MKGDLYKIILEYFYWVLTHVYSLHPIDPKPAVAARAVFSQFGRSFFKENTPKTINQFHSYILINHDRTLTLVISGNLWGHHEGKS